MNLQGNDFFMKDSDQKLFNKIGIGLILGAIALPFLGVISPLDVRTLNYISFGMIILALILFGRMFWQWHTKEDLKDIQKELKKGDMEKNDFTDRINRR